MEDQEATELVGDDEQEVVTVEATTESNKEGQVNGEKPEAEHQTAATSESLHKHQWSPILKSGMIILIFWNVGISLMFTSYKYVPALNNYFTTYGLDAVMLLFSPLAVYLADTRWGRRKTVTNSLCFMFWSVLMIVVFNCLVTIGFIPIFTNPEHAWNSRNTIATVLLGLAFVPPCILGIMLIIVSLVAYSANVIQLGWDQLHALPKENAMLYIHWFVWSSFIGQIILKWIYGIAASEELTYSFIGQTLVMTVPGFLLAFAISLCCAYQYKSKLFKVDDQIQNPYKIIKDTIRFAKLNKRTSLSRGENSERPHSRLDAAKEEFGGPFDSDKVENVKTFISLCFIMLSLGPTLAIEIAASEQLPHFAYHIDPSNASNAFIISALTPLVVLVLVPVYTCLLRPCIRKRTPGPLTRISLGMILFFVSILICLVIDTLGHVSTQSTACFLAHDYPLPPYVSYKPQDCQDVNTTSHDNDANSTLSGTKFTCLIPLGVSISALLIPYIINGVAYVLFYISVYEFIWMQAPDKMKGVVIGVFFAIKGGFQLLALLLVYAPFTAWSSYTAHYFPSCGSVYWLINAIVALVGITAFVWRARRYRYREYQRSRPLSIFTEHSEATTV